MTTGWKHLRLVDAAEAVLTGPFGSMLHKSDYVLGGVPIVNPINIVDSVITQDASKSVKEGKARELGSYVLRQDDVVVARRGEIGRCGVVGEGQTGWLCGTGCFVVRPGKHLDARFLALMLGSPDYRRQLEKLATGATMLNLSNDSLQGLLVPIPPLDEQRRIVAVLDEAFAGIATATANAQKNLTNARALFQSTLDAIFDSRDDTWQDKRFEAICENLDGKRRPVTKRDRQAGDIPYYGASGQVDSVSSFLFDDHLLLVSEDGANLLARTYPIAFSISGKAWVNNHAHVLRFKERVTQTFVELYLNSISLEPYVSGMAQPKLTQKALNGIVVPMPPLDRQREIVAEMEAMATGVEALETTYRTKLNALSELNQSLLQKAFAGELT